VTSINKKVAGIAAVGAAALAIGFGISSAAQADDATPTPSPTTQSGSGNSNGNNGNNNGNGWGPGGRHGMGGMGAFAGDLSELASKLGVDEAKLRDAMSAVRDDLKKDLKDLRDAAKDNPTTADRQAMRDQMQQKLADALAAQLGIDSSKVSSALADLEAAHEAERDQALTDRLDQGRQGRQAHPGRSRRRQEGRGRRRHWCRAGDGPAPRPWPALNYCPGQGRRPTSPRADPGPHLAPGTSSSSPRADPGPQLAPRTRLDNG